jgi:hypothetical protein
MMKASAKAFVLSNVIIISCSIPGIAFNEPDICFSQSFKQRIIDPENKKLKNRLKIKNLTPSYKKGEENPYLTEEAENTCSYLTEFAEGSTQSITVFLKNNGRFTVRYNEYLNWEGSETNS